MAHKDQNNNEIIDEVMGKFSPNSKNHKIKRNCKMFLKNNWTKNDQKNQKILPNYQSWKIGI
jgi:hypothetical protein